MIIYISYDDNKVRLINIY